MSLKTMSRIVTCLAAALVCQLALVAQGSDQGQSNGDGQEEYRVQYSVYDAARNEKDVDKRAAAYLDFLKRFPNSKLEEYVVGEYKQLMQDAYDSKETERLVKLGEDFLAAKPGDVASLYFLANGLFNTAQWSRAINYAEQLHEVADNAQVKSQSVFILAFAALRSNDTDRLMKYGDEACANLQPKDCYAVRIEQMRIALSQKRQSMAAQYAKKALEGIQAVAATNQDPAVKKYIDENRLRALWLLGEQDWEKERWQSAMSNYQAVLKYAHERELRSEMFYKIGMCLWRMGKTDTAMEVFARGSLTGPNPHAKECRRHLETLYKAGHNGSTAGIEEYIAGVQGE